MSAFPDLAHRCDRHIGEVFPPRCYDCMALTPPTAPVVGGRCARHPEYPASERSVCAKCAQDRETTR